MAKFDIMKHKELADKRRQELHPNLADTNTTGVKTMKSAVGLVALIFLMLNVYTLPIAQPLVWILYALLLAVYVFFLKKLVWINKNN